jgi:hypothetical protein
LKDTPSECSKGNMREKKTDENMDKPVLEKLCWSLNRLTSLSLDDDDDDDDDYDYHYCAHTSIGHLCGKPDVLTVQKTLLTHIKR